MSGLFDGLIGHGQVVGLLNSELEAPAQAYLLVGPGSIGKNTVATRFAAGLLAAGATSEEAAVRATRLALAGTHPDLWVVEPEGASNLGVEQARDVVGRSAMTPVEGDRMVFLFPDAGSMTESAANALLKTLEEPGSSVVFLLVAESEDDFPPTVASRCRTIQMGRVPVGEIASALVERGLPNAEANGVAIVSGGRPGLALSLMTRPEVARFREMWLQVPTRVSPHPGDGLRLAGELLSALTPLIEDALPDDLGKDKAQRLRRRTEATLIVNGLEILASWYTDSASLQMGGPIRNGDLPLTELTDVSPRKAVASAEAVLDAVVDIQANLRRELVLADLFSRLGSNE